LAIWNGLTGIFNRRYFETRITEEIERAGGSAPSFAHHGRRDKFKSLNDSFGHLWARGLRQVSSLCVATVRKIDVVCRYVEKSLHPAAGKPRRQLFTWPTSLRRALEEWHFPGFLGR